MKQPLSKTPAQLFCEGLLRGCEAWLEIGKIAAAELDKNPDWAEEVAKIDPFPPAGSVKQFARIGRMQLHAKLLAPGPIGLQRLARMPYALQEKYLKQPVEVLVEKGETLLIDVHNLTDEQAAQVFSKDDVRDIPEQRAWLSTVAMQKAAPPARANLPYRIVGKKLVCMAGCTLERKELARLLAEME